MKTLRILVLAVMGAVVATGCGGKKSSGCGSGGTGNLQVTIAGLPGGVPANVTISGFAGVVTSSGTVAVTGGENTLVAATVAESSSLVRKAYSGEASASPVCVKNGQTAQVTVTYTLVPSSNKLWSTMANGAEDLAGYAESALGTSATVSPTAAVTGGLTKGAGVAFDRDGNLWVSDASVLSRFPARSLGATATITPDITLSSAILTEAVPGPAGLAFDAAGNLWVALTGDNKIARFTPADLLASGAPTPAVVLGGMGSGLNGPAGIAFDASGNLWVAHGDGVSRYDAASLASSTVAPAATITADSKPPVVNALTGATGLAVDAVGNLWVSYFGSNVIAALAPVDQAGTGSITVTPAIQITIDVTALLEGIALDDQGGLWTPYTTGKIGRLSPAQLSTSGTIAPSTILSDMATGDFAELAFYPAPAGLPLFDSL